MKEIRKHFLPFFSNKCTYFCRGVKIISYFEFSQQVANEIFEIVYKYTEPSYSYGSGAQISREVFYFIKESLKIIKPIKVIFKHNKKYFIVKIIKEK